MDKPIRWNGWGWPAHPDDPVARDDFWRWLADSLAMPALLATPPKPLTDCQLPPTRLGATEVAGLARICGLDRLDGDDGERARHARGRSYRDVLQLRQGDFSTAPDLVIRPRGEEDILAILTFAAEKNIPVVPFAGGAGGLASGGAGSISLDLTGMDRLVAIDGLGSLAEVEAGITVHALERALALQNLSFEPSPAGLGTLGGRIAGRDPEIAWSDWLIAARLATAHGAVVLDDGVPDLRGILAGMQGALGVITRITLRVRPAPSLPPQAFFFPDFAAACAALRGAARNGLCFRLLDLIESAERRLYRALAGPAGTPSWRERMMGRLKRPREDDDRSLLLTSFPDRHTLQAFAGLAARHGAVAAGEEAESALAWRARRAHWRDVLLDHGVGQDVLTARTRWSSLAAIRQAASAALEAAMRQEAAAPGGHGMVLTRLKAAGADSAVVAFTAIFPRALNHEIAQADAIRQAGLRAIAGSPGSAISRAAWLGLKSALDPEGILNPGVMPF